jgi:hypothetical protein
MKSQPLNDSVVRLHLKLLINTSDASLRFYYRECASMMVGLHQKAASSKLVVVHKKYSSSKFQSVAQLAPANLIFNTEEQNSN